LLIKESVSFHAAIKHTNKVISKTAPAIDQVIACIMMDFIDCILRKQSLIRERILFIVLKLVPISINISKERLKSKSDLKQNLHKTMFYRLLRNLP
jgi:phage-related holin